MDLTKKTDFLPSKDWSIFRQNVEKDYIELITSRKFTDTKESIR